MAKKRVKPPTIVDGHVSYRLRDEALADVVNAFWPGMSPRNADVYSPSANQLVAKGGTWAMIVRRLPPIEHALDERVTVGRVFYVEHCGNVDEDGFLPDGTYKVLSHTPWGDVWLWPYEYAVLPVSLIIGLWADGGLTFHPTNVEPVRFNEIVFYARSRGITLAEALPMALGTFSAPVGWFDAAPDLVEFVGRFKHVGELTDENHRRRASVRTLKGAAYRSRVVSS